MQSRFLGYDKELCRASSHYLGLSDCSSRDNQVKLHYSTVSDGKTDPVPDGYHYTVVGLTMVVVLVLITLRCGGTTASQRAIAKGSPKRNLEMTSRVMHSIALRIPGTTS